MNPAEFFLERSPEVLNTWQNSTIGIAGAGGLGSNAAMLLARAGIGRLIIADFDVVSISNLNRQHYFLDQVGRPKVQALQENIAKANPFCQVVIHHDRLNEENIPLIYPEVNVMIEAFDTAGAKAMLIEAWNCSFPEKPLICASGLAGYGNNNDIRQISDGNLHFIGDFTSELVPGLAPISARVMIVAAMQANLALELLLQRNKLK